MHFNVTEKFCEYQNMYDFGLQDSEMENIEIIQQKIIEIDKNFDLVLIQERYQFISNDFVY